MFPLGVILGACLLLLILAGFVAWAIHDVSNSMKRGEKPWEE